ncbi:helix-turn-helix transcriptional regulator [Lutimaribacter sp. EGI FJ00015]|uniref:Helix-turn-helix transcriptional regulator n=1 Tax=Lutimaribacter degradans TaxID=2945989 RepID=A0ACC5ZY67_9RHOB|nr:helix-turn-helix transcriptional regulator [Lutimaribacter sp. EGI FJ00013]MCM2563318.1 helix-turn-helix transcriptional regulator [Lutimaribacter sp. EGI FJ00013]MCO0614605.1 helix-turn-helix transcriptional regulator [Lutimaribacter sp. EGI FJ00015]MCO0637276.1 helix-turn-helix transcriptional regulator [Lutimaribacter sp. EGI FJ00014]
MSEELRQNLTLLCSYFPSIAEVCRKLDINRQQFNKYLAGNAHPSRHNMRRICDFFGVSESELLMEPQQFEEIVALKRKPPQQQALSKPLRHLEKLYQRSQELEKYVGYYFRYFYSFGNRGKVIRSLAVVYKEDDKYYWKNIEILRDPMTGRTSGLNKYEGVLFYLADRLHVIEYETIEVNTITQATLYPSHRSRIGVLLGIQTGGPTRRGRKPGASKVALEYLGRDINVREALKRTGLYDPKDGLIRSEILSLIENSLDPGTFVLDVEEP